MKYSAQGQPLSAFMICRDSEYCLRRQYCRNLHEMAVMCLHPCAQIRHTPGMMSSYYSPLKQEDDCVVWEILLRNVFISSAIQIHHFSGNQKNSMFVERFAVQHQIEQAIFNTFDWSNICINNTSTSGRNNHIDLWKIYEIDHIWDKEGFWPTVT